MTQGRVKPDPGLLYCPLVVKVQLILETLDTVDNVLMAPLYVSNGCQSSLSFIVLSALISEGSVFYLEIQVMVL